MNELPDFWPNTRKQRTKAAATRLSVPFWLAVHQPNGGARLRLRLRTARRVNRIHQVEQECRRLRAAGPKKLVREVFGIGIDRMRESFALRGIGRLDDGLDCVKQLPHAGEVVRLGLVHLLVLSDRYYFSLRLAPCLCHAASRDHLLYGLYSPPAST